jgi:ring-1,2-phenylacetyl-CoA epoxidase subunit PaaD
VVSAERQSDAGTEERVWQLLSDIPDPEIPLVSIVDLGIVRHVAVNPEGIEVGLTPTYSGCPATDVIREQVEEALARQRIAARVRMIVSPAWTTEWISAEGRRKLGASGIVPPRLLAGTGVSAMVANEESVACPRCRSMRTERLSEFGSTPCKSLYRCLECLEPFERFKCL